MRCIQFLVKILKIYIGQTKRNLRVRIFEHEHSWMWGWSFYNSAKYYKWQWYSNPLCFHWSQIFVWTNQSISKGTQLFPPKSHRRNTHIQQKWFLRQFNCRPWNWQELESDFEGPDTSLNPPLPVCRNSSRPLGFECCICIVCVSVCFCTSFGCTYFQQQ